MAEPTLAMSFDDLQLRVAEYLGIAYYGSTGLSAASNPDNTLQPADSDLCKRLVNDGWRQFVGGHHRWHWQTPTFTITFDPTGAGTQCPGDDPARYYLPDGFMGQLLGEFTYPTTGPRVRIENTTDQHIRELYAASGGVTGTPVLAAVRPLSVAVGSFPSEGGRWEAWFYPTPSTEYVVTNRCRILPNKMVNTTDRHNAGSHFDFAVLASCLAVAERYKNGGSAGPLQKAWEDALRRAILLDASSNPQRLGYNGDGSDGVGMLSRPYTGVDTYNGVSVE
jgi:hypothetical protein